MLWKYSARTESFFSQTIKNLWDENGDEISSAPHAQQSIRILMEEPVAENYMVRKQI